MKTLDLRKTLPETVAILGERGEFASVTAVLETLGIDLSPSLGPVRAEPLPDGSSAASLLSLGRFQLVGELGRGGMGRVLEARDPELRRSVAVKVVIDPTQVTEAQLVRFVAEAQITSQLEHPNIVPVHDVGISPCSSRATATGTRGSSPCPCPGCHQGSTERARRKPMMRLRKSGPYPPRAATRR